MNHYHRPWFIPAFFLLLLCMTPCVSAFTVSSVDVKPAGFQPAGTSMTVISVINFPAASAKTFPNSSELRMSTDLVEPYWVPLLVLDGTETRMDIQSGNEFILAGDYLSYPPSQSVQLMVTLTGKIPSDRSAAANILEIQERDSAKNIVSSAHIAMPESAVIPVTTLTAPTKKTTTMKIFTPIPTDTTHASPVGIGAGILAVIGAVLLVLWRR
jgi:hypothetical protein